MESARQHRLNVIAEVHATLDSRLRPVGTIDMHNIQRVVAEAARLMHARQHNTPEKAWPFSQAMRQDMIFRVVRWLLIDRSLQDAAFADDLVTQAMYTDSIITQACQGCAQERRAAKRRRGLLHFFCC